MKSWMIAIVCIFFSPLNNVFCNDSYTIADLEILAKTGPYPEFFNHIYDIRPAQRNEAWIDLARSTSEKYVQHLYNNKIIDLKHWQEIRELTVQAYNKDNDGLKLVRNKYGTSLIDFCFKAKDFSTCYPLGLEIFGDQTDPQLAHDLGRIIQNYFEQNPDQSHKLLEHVWPFYKVMAAHPLSEFYCDKNYFQDIVLSILHQKISDLPQEKIQPVVFKTMHQDCWAQIASKLKSEIAQNLTHKMNYKLLLATNKIDPKELATFKIVYLLQEFQDGSLLEKSFKTLLDLKNNFEERQRVLERLKTLDPLPGKIFSKINDRRSLVVVKNLSKFFPEYVDYYAKTCLDYLSGDRKFPKGNPTLECKDFFRMTRKIELVPDMVVKRYNQIRKFKNL